MNSYRKDRGFTLIEMMVTIAIIAILSVVAAVGYKRYIHKARVSEATAFLASIKMKQETYFQTYGQYVDSTISSPACNHNASDLYPALTALSLPVEMSWNIECPDDQETYAGWCALGARPIGGGHNAAPTSNFQYVTIGWAPDDCDPPTRYIQDPNRRWWYAVAHSDMDRDGVLSTFIMSSESADIHMFNETD